MVEVKSWWERGGNRREELVGKASGRGEELVGKAVATHFGFVPILHPL